jgi:heat shock protein HslJ/uncharacterized membrane protein
MRQVRHQVAVAVAAIGVALSARADDAAVRSLQCRGNEPFWSLEATDRSARLSALGAEERIFSGEYVRLAFMRPEWGIWRGTDRRDAAATLVATFRAEPCRDTMSDEGPRFDHRAVLSLPGEKPLVGCCRAIAALDTGTAPVAQASGKADNDWSRWIDDLLPAMRACVVDAGIPAEAVTKAWPMNRGMVGVRLQRVGDGRYDCIAYQDGGAIDRLASVELADRLPGEGAPIFYPARELAPIVTSGRLERVEDRQGAVQGWLHYAGGVEPTRQADSSPLVGRTWRLEDIERRGVIDNLNSPITIAADGKVSGDAGCNRMTGQATVSGTAIRFGPLATTRRACPPAIMDQERRFLDALGRVARWRIERGLLFLIDAEGRDLLRFAP